MSFQRALANVLKNEGGYVADLGDGAGPTNMGISQRSFPNLDIKSLTVQQVTLIYESMYWSKIQGDSLPDPVSFALLDFAVNSGVAGAIRALQRCLGVPIDGVMGPITVKACQLPGVVTKLSVERIFLLTGLVDWKDFGEGWITRVINTAIAAFQTQA